MSRIGSCAAGLAPAYDVVVVGLGVTGAGVALDRRLVGDAAC